MAFRGRASRDVAGLLLLVLLLVAVGTLVLAAGRDPWDPDETRYLQITREMLDRENPFLLTFDGEPYSDKPPLYFWAMAPLVAVLGPTSALAGMLPALLAFLLLPVAVARLGRNLDLDVVTGRWGGFLAVTMFLPALVAGGCRMDLPFTLLIVLALAELGRLANHRTRTALPFWVLTGLAVLTKGPLAIILPLLAAAPLLRDHRLRRRLFSLRSVAAGVAVVAVWLVPAAIAGGREWFMDAVVHQSAGRAVASFAHREPWWYHLGTVPLGLIPWSFAVLAALTRLATQRHALAGAGRLLLHFPVATILLLSAISGKTLLYPLPLYPVVALAAAWWILDDPGAPSRRLVLGLAGALGLLLAAGHLLVLAPHRDLALEGFARWAPAIGMAIPSLAALALAGAGAGLAAARAAALVVPLFIALVLPAIGPGMNRLLSLRPFAEAYLDLAPDEPKGYAYAKIQPGFILFTGRPFVRLDRPSQLWHAVDAGHAVAIEQKTFRRLPAHVRARLPVRARVPYRHTEILIVRSPAGPGTPGK